MITIYTGNIARQMETLGDTGIIINPAMKTSQELVEQGIAFAKIDPSLVGNCAVITNSYDWFTGLRVGIKESSDPTTHLHFSVILIDAEGRQHPAEFDIDGNPVRWHPDLFKGLEDALLRLL